MLFLSLALGQLYEFRIKIDGEMKKESNNIEHDTDKIPTANILKLENGTSVHCIHRSSILTLCLMSRCCSYCCCYYSRNIICIRAHHFSLILSCSDRFSHSNFNVLGTVNEMSKNRRAFISKDRSLFVREQKSCYILSIVCD